MTDTVTLSPDHELRSLEVALNLRYAAHVRGWITPPDTAFISAEIDEVTDGPLDAFYATDSASSLDVTIQSGEGVIEGALVARDVDTTVTLPANTADVVVHVAWDPTSNDALLIDTAANIPSNHPSLPVWSFTTDGSGVTSRDDLRLPLGEQTDVQNSRYEDGGDGVPVDAADTAANADSAANADMVDGYDVQKNGSDGAGIINFKT